MNVKIPTTPPLKKIAFVLKLPCMDALLWKSQVGGGVGFRLGGPSTGTTVVLSVGAPEGDTVDGRSKTGLSDGAGNGEAVTGDGPGPGAAVTRDGPGAVVAGQVGIPVKHVMELGHSNPLGQAVYQEHLATAS
jgi:hypothetical protein